MSSNMYPYTRPTEGGTLAVSENGVVDLAGTNYSKINVNVSGGSVNLGPLGWAASASGTPTVGSMAAEGDIITEAKLGNTVVASGGGYSINGTVFAAGLTLSTIGVTNSEVVCTAYITTVDSNGRYATVEEWDGTLTRKETTVEGNQAWYWEFVMPELAEGEALELFLHLP